MKKIQVRCVIATGCGLGCNLKVYLSEQNEEIFTWSCPGASKGAQYRNNPWETVDIGKTSLLAMRLLCEDIK